MTIFKQQCNYFILSFVIIFSGCVSSSKITNVALNNQSDNEFYTHKKHPKKNNDIQIFLSFSGGGTRAAALSYGVLETLRDTEITINNKSRSLLSEVDVISSVSGGSFTSAYYGLYGDKIFQDFEKVFLKQNVQNKLISRLLDPLNWFRFTFSNFNRTELAVNYYDKYIFDGATFSDFRKDMPLIKINATDLSNGLLFIFNDAYFNLLCSDISQFKVARAVAASSAVPVVFAPIVLKNHKECTVNKTIENLVHIRNQDNIRVQKLKMILQRYLDKNKLQYIHLVDGGIADNLGLRALYNSVNLFGGASQAVKARHNIRPKYLVVIVVNAETTKENKMDTLANEPSFSEQISAMSSAQLYRFNTESILLLRRNLNIWAKELTETTGQEVKPFFIMIDFDEMQNNTENNWVNRVSTSLGLPAEQVDELRSAARELLRNSPEFQRLLSETNAVH